MNASQSIAAYAARLSYEALPAPAVDAVKRDVLDTLATALGGSARPGVLAVVELAQSWESKPEATSLVYGSRMAAPLAALCNGTMAHALDFDDTFDFGPPFHTGVAVVPAALAAAEHLGGASGKELIPAIAAGIDLMCRLSRATTAGLRGWHLTSLYGYLGSALASGMLLRLSEEQLLNALGIAYSQCAGNLRCINDGALSKRLQAGLAAKGGLLAAQLAQRGVTGAHDIFEGENSLFPVYFRGEYDPTPLTEKLGVRFDVTNLSFKPWPACRATHPFIEASLRLMQEQNIKPEQIAEVTAAPPIFFEPSDVKRRPRTIVDAQFSVPYTMAVALVKGAVKIEDFTEESIRNEQVLALAARIGCRELPDRVERYQTYVKDAIVEVKTRDGRTLSQSVGWVYGHPENPMSWESLAAKFRDCAAWSVKPISPQAVEQAIGFLAQLEREPDVRPLIRLLSGEAR